MKKRKKRFTELWRLYFLP